MEAKINTTYFIAKEKLPFSKFEGLLMSQSKNGVILNNIYANKKSCAELVSFLSEGLRDDPIHVLKWKNYFSLMADRNFEKKFLFSRWPRAAIVYRHALR